MESKTLEIIKSSEQRNRLSEHTEILDKIKIIPYYPEELFVGINHASNFYNTTVSTIQSVISRHADEFKLDGVKKIDGDELKNYRLNVIKHDIVDVDGNQFIGSKSRSYTIIPKRALLRIGMLLKKSDVAKQVRQYLLELEDIATTDQKKTAALTANEAYINSLSLEDDLKKQLLTYNYENKKQEESLSHAIKKCTILGLNKKESAILVQDAIINNIDIDNRILEVLKNKLTSEKEKYKGILYQRIKFIADSYFNNNYGYVCKQICEKLKYKIGKDIYKEYYSKKNQNLVSPLTYADLFLKHNAYNETLDCINELIDELEENIESFAKEIEKDEKESNSIILPKETITVEKEEENPKKEKINEEIKPF
jgi:hypothetical protein